MRITKYGHSCLYVEVGSVRILIDPGNYVFLDAPIKPEDLPPCNVLLLTHEHPDHTYPEALKVILQKSKPLILTNAEVQNMLRNHGIESEILKPGDERIVVGEGLSFARQKDSPSGGGVTIRAVACDHGHIADHIPRVENVGFLIAGRLFHPGDCVAPPAQVRCEILAVPVAAPWMKISEGLEFVKKVKPKVAIPIHDAILRWPETPWHKIFETGLEGSGIEFVEMEIGRAKEF